MRPSVVGRGHHRARVAETGESLLVPNALQCEYGGQALPGTQEIDESLAARAAALRLARHRRDRDLEARAEPVRRRRRPAARGARRPGVRRARECAPLRPAAPRGAEGAKASARLPADEVSRAQTVDEICTRHTVRDGGDALRDRRRVTSGSRATPATSTASASCGSPTGSRATTVGRCAREWRRAVPRRGRSRGAAPRGRRRDRADRGDEGQPCRGSRGGAAPARGRSRTRRRPRLQQGPPLLASSSRRREIANALLEASRELATADTPDELCSARTVEVTARVLGAARAALWIQEDGPRRATSSPARPAGTRRCARP